METKSGNHLAVIRSWVQRKDRNGSTITWGSQEQVQLSGVTMYELEQLAQQIADASVKESLIKLEAEKKLLEAISKLKKQLGA